MWQRFTERARRVILLAQEEADEMGSGFVGTDHLLLGLLSEEGGVASQVLRQMSVSLDETREKVRAQNVPASQSGVEPKLTPAGKRTLKLAADESQKMRHTYIGTEHLLLAVFRASPDIAEMLNLDAKKVRAAIMEYLGTDASTREANEESENRALRREIAKLRNKLIELREQSGDPETLALRHEITIKENENAMLRERIEMLRARLAPLEEKRAPDENV